MEPFGALFAKWHQKYQKALGFSVKVGDVLRLWKTSENL